MLTVLYVAVIVLVVAALVFELYSRWPKVEPPEHAAWPRFDARFTCPDTGHYRVITLRAPNDLAAVDLASVRQQEMFGADVYPFDRLTQTG